jgi:hypothetical protein
MGMPLNLCVGVTFAYRFSGTSWGSRVWEDLDSEVADRTDLLNSTVDRCLVSLLGKNQKNLDSDVVLSVKDTDVPRFTYTLSYPIRMSAIFLCRETSERLYKGDNSIRQAFIGKLKIA